MSLDDETNTLFLTSVGGKRFIVTVSAVAADKAIIELWAKKNPELMSIVLGVVYMRDLGGSRKKKQVNIYQKLLKGQNNVFGKDFSLRNNLG